MTLINRLRAAAEQLPSGNVIVAGLLVSELLLEAAERIEVLQKRVDELHTENQIACAALARGKS